MCKRLVIPEQEAAEREISVDQRWWRFSVRFNVAVTHRVPVARLHEVDTEGVMMRWGFVPSTDDREVGRVGSAFVRSDAMLSSRDYRKAWLYGQRCVVPLAGFYMWHLSATGVWQPFYVRLVNRAVFGVAALWERTVIDGDDVVDSCALLTVPANPLMAEIAGGTRQMPAILRQQDYHTWLTSTAGRAQALLQPYPLERMVTHAVGPRVNYLEYDDPWLIRPAHV
jgi:putative SOS response-associated peptidase YedK